MQIVIDIPDVLYEKIKNRKADKRTLETVILFGDILPKGHGRLIDTDVLVDGFEDNFEFCEVVNATPTVIEADPCDNDCEHCDWVTCPKMEGEEGVRKIRTIEE